MCRSSLIHFACIGVSPLDWSYNLSRGATSMQAKWFKLDLISTYLPHLTMFYFRVVTFLCSDVDFFILNVSAEFIVLNSRPLHDCRTDQTSYIYVYGDIGR